MVQKKTLWPIHSVICILYSTLIHREVILDCELEITGVLSLFFWDKNPNLACSSDDAANWENQKIQLLRPNGLHHQITCRHILYVEHVTYITAAKIIIIIPIYNIYLYLCVIFVCLPKKHQHPRTKTSCNKGLKAMLAWSGLNILMVHNSLIVPFF